MITSGQLLAFGLAAFVLIAIPGPSVVFVISRALVYGRAVALATVVGNSLGLLVIITAVALGLGVVVAESIIVFTVIKIVGAVYLVWLGIQALRHRADFTSVTVGDDRPMPVGRAVRQGFVVGVTNPKAFMIFGAVLPQFLDRGAGHLPVQMLLLGLVGFAIGLVSDGLWALIASRLREWFASSPRRGQAVGTAGGVSMIGLGVSLAVTNHR